MFAAILRRWRLVTPLALAVLAIMIVTGGVLGTASAHNIKFHFWGRAYAFNDVGVLPNTACDTGFLPLTGQVTLDTGNCFGAGGAGSPGNGTTGVNNNGAFGRLWALYARETVTSKHGSVSGSVTSKYDLEGSVAACLTALATNQGSSDAVSGGALGCSGFWGGNPAATLGEFTGCPGSVVETRNAGTISRTNRVDGILVFCASDVEGFATASCHSHSNGSTQANVTSNITLLNAPAFSVDGQRFYIGSSNGLDTGGFGQPNEAFAYNLTTSRHHFSFTVSVVINEVIPFVDGGFGAITENALHIIISGRDLSVKADFIIGHAFAAVHCAKHLGTVENIGFLGSND